MGSCIQSGMRRSLPIVVVILMFALIAMVIWVSNRLDFQVKSPVQPAAKSESKPPPQAEPTTTESLLAGYADPASPPLEDLRKLHQIGVGYFSRFDDSRHFPIGGNKDFSAALQGENPGREIFVRRDHPVFSAAGLLIDRWGSPLIVHPQAWGRLELRSAGPDRIPYNQDDLVLNPSGSSSRGN
jgi:hypothetical protein